MGYNQGMKVLIAMSGGVDSSVAALLLKQQGYDVIGGTMEIYQTEKAVEDSRKIAKKLDIPFNVFDFRDIFKEKVMKYFVDEYLAGRTPNPCVVCNKEIKFNALLDGAMDLGAEYIATGHYAQIEERDGRYLLKKGKSSGKDQAYFLYRLTQEQLSRILFPIGGMEKEEVRRIAKENDLFVAEKEDSQEVCFVEDNDYVGFIEGTTKKKMPNGKFVDVKGNVLGEHGGVYNYTVGQRKGLGIASNKPLFVVDIDVKRNIIVLGDDEDTLGDTLVASNLNWIMFEKLEKEMRVTAKIRYGAKEAGCTISPMSDGKVKVVFDTPQRAITPGQSVVFYDHDYIVGGGVIE